MRESRILVCIACQHSSVVSSSDLHFTSAQSQGSIWLLIPLEFGSPLRKVVWWVITALRTWAFKNCLQVGTFSYSWSLELCSLVHTCHDTHFDCELSGVGFVSWLGRHWLSEEQTWWALAASGSCSHPALSNFSKTLTSLAGFISYNWRLN